MYLSQISGGLVGVGMVFGVAASLPEPDFLKVLELEATAQGASVRVVREIKGPSVVADWRVTIVGMDDNAPSCATIPGPRLHEGWSDYRPSESKEQKMPLDVWVGDPGCYARLTPGEYKEFTTWTPRDGRAPVTYRRTFEKPAG